MRASTSVIPSLNLPDDPPPPPFTPADGVITARRFGRNLALQMGPLSYATEANEMCIQRWHLYNDGTIAFGSSPRLLLHHVFTAHATKMNELSEKMERIVCSLNSLSDRLKKVEDSLAKIIHPAYYPKE